jgi:hypothetical protein
MSDYRYEDLFDIENRPGAGVRLWGKAVEDQIRRVVVAGNQHRQNNAPDGVHIPEGERIKPDPEAERRLHTEVYFLALSIRRVLLFHEAISKQIRDARLAQARATFVAAAPQAKDFRDFFEHLDEYLLGAGRAQQEGRVAGRISPILRLRWGQANVVVDFGGATLDVTAAGEAAVKLAEATETVWEEDRDKARTKTAEEPCDDGVTRMLEVTTSTSTVIGGEDEGHIVTTGILLGVNVRPARPDEIEADSAGVE